VTILHNFRADQGDGNGPNGPLVQASDGNFYGTTLAGGPEVCRPVAPIPCGIVFKMTPDGTESVFHAFGSIPNDGYTPVGALIQASDGALYGLTSNGGDFGGGGTVFKITLDGAYTVLHSFGGTADDGVVPMGGLVQATDGNFYGVTASGGANHCFQIPQGGGNCGTIFKMAPSGATTILYSFGTSDSDGVTPMGPLLQASDGNFYGTTANGGANACTTSNETNNCGTLFMMTPTGETTVLHSFGPTFRDPIAPLSGLIEGTDGALYGTTVSGGGGNCNFAFSCGAVYRITMAGELTILYAFALTSREDGYGPSQLILASDGNFYGTTGSGGENLGDLEGTAFKLTPAGVLTTLYSFGPRSSKESNPVGGLVEGNDGAFYGVTTYSVAFPETGSVFKLVTP
jgi:uncharacterized repeat protein (TIGR03803 family)